MEMKFEKFEANAQKLFENIKSSFRLKIAENPSYAEEVSDAIVARLVEEILRETTCDIHRAIKLGYSNLVYAKTYDHSLDDIDLPFYPENVDSKTEDINCPKCHKLIHASRFAPHLERCMQQGRNSSRIASQRIANNSKECSYGMGSDEDDDWKAEKSRSVKKIDGKRKKDSARKQKPYKSDLSKNQKDAGNISANIKDIFQSTSKSGREHYGKSSKDQDPEVWISPNKVASGIDDKSLILSTRCGVKSDHTGKYCGRSLRCPLHSDADRAVARKLLSGESMDIDVEDVESLATILGNKPVPSISTLSFPMLLSSRLLPCSSSSSPCPSLSAPAVLSSSLALLGTNP
ncbi:unnamed protein product [Nezara viridula]|uniref:SCA7 domain-containing protein n=1 Tax=Nezara viridula TaxID=85310 RepID=A0A9P0EC23_NEZVI|nr:unnamed protein product [Nezara viridula]